MVTFNLFPWRERKTQYEARVTKIILAISILIGFLLHFCGYQYVSYQKNKIDFELIQMRKIEENYIEQIQLGQKKLSFHHLDQQINQLKMKQQLLQKMLNELSVNSRNDICFTEIRRERNTINLIGNVNSAHVLTEWLTHWNVSYLFSHIIIKQLKLNSATGFTEFSLVAIEN